MLDAMSRSSFSAAKGLRVRSALNPMLWLTAIVSPTALTVAYMFRESPSVVLGLLLLAALPVVVTCLGFGFFAFRNPDKLQSEEYQLRHETLQLLQSKGGPIRIDATSLNAITNPALPRLSSGPEGLR